MCALQGGQSYQCRRREALILTQLLLAWLTSGFTCIVSAVPDDRSCFSLLVFPPKALSSDESHIGSQDQGIMQCVHNIMLLPCRFESSPNKAAISGL